MFLAPHPVQNFGADTTAGDATGLLTAETGLLTAAGTGLLTAAGTGLLVAGVGWVVTGLEPPFLIPASSAEGMARIGAPDEADESHDGVEHQQMSQG